MRIAREEVFGPVLVVLTYTHLDEAVALAHDTDSGPAAYVSGQDLDVARRLAARLAAGQVSINGALRSRGALRWLQAQRQRPRVRRARVPRVPREQGAHGVRRRTRRLASTARGPDNRVDDERMEAQRMTVRPGQARPRVTCRRFENDPGPAWVPASRVPIKRRRRRR